VGTDTGKRGSDVQNEKDSMSTVDVILRLFELEARKSRDGFDLNENGFRTPRTTMLNAVHLIVKELSCDLRGALSIENNPTIDKILFIGGLGLIFVQRIIRSSTW
jgi:hypothetical protein